MPQRPIADATFGTHLKLLTPRDIRLCYIVPPLLYRIQRYNVTVRRSQANQKETIIIIPDTIYITPDDLYRVASSTSPQFTKIRPAEITIIERIGVKFIVANGKGVSVYNELGLGKTSLTGWVWKMPKGTALNPKLKFTKDQTPEGHYTICPIGEMAVSEFIAALESMVVKCQKINKKLA